jgi:hypothetical protein
VPAPSRPRPAALLLLAGGAAYAFILATTTAFTTGADILTALPLAALAVAIFLRWPLRTRTVRFPRTAPAGRPFRPWLAWFVLLSAWEAYEYLARGSRAEHPTFSSMSDAVDRYYLLKVLVVLAWLALGWAMLRRGSRQTKFP